MYLHLFGGCSGYASPVDPELWFVPTYYVTGSCTLKWLGLSDNYGKTVTISMVHHHIHSM